MQPTWDYIVLGAGHNGLFVYWFPFCGFFLWLSTTMYLMRSKLKLQLVDEMREAVV